MNPIRRWSQWIGLLGVLALVLVTPVAIAQDFGKDCQPAVGPPCDDDPIDSLGQYKIWVLPPYRPLLVGHPYYDGVTTLTSPVMHDPQTIVGRSAPHDDGDLTDTTGADVGSPPPTIISDADLIVRPPGFEGPPGTREVHTELRSLNMNALDGSGAWLHAGAPGFGLPLSPGEVESQAAPGSPPADDFPADSHFNVLAEVFVPPFGAWPGAIVYNPAPTPMNPAGTPMVVEATILDFPPAVIYIHGSTPAVPVLFLEAGPGWFANAPFGFLILAGHGMGYTDQPGDVADFGDFMGSAPGTPPPPTVGCDGAESGGTGIVDPICVPGPRMYAYPATDTTGTMSDLYIGTEDCYAASYSAICMPPGWTFAIEYIPMLHDPPKTPHGVVTPGPNGLCPCRVHWNGPPGLPGGAFTFGFNNKQPSHDVDFLALDAGLGAASNWAMSVGSGLGPVHGPALVIPAVSQWGLAVLVLLVLAAATVVLRRRRALAA